MNDMVEISLEEYRELLTIKGKYEELTKKENCNCQCCHKDKELNSTDAPLCML